MRNLSDRFSRIFGSETALAFSLSPFSYFESLLLVPPLTIHAQSVTRYNKKLALVTTSRNEQFRWCVCGTGSFTEQEVRPSSQSIKLILSTNGYNRNQPGMALPLLQKRHCFICREESSDACDHLCSIDGQKSRKKQQQQESAY